MATEKTELEWPYSPADFFEAPYRRQTDDYALVADNGMVRVTLSVPSDPIDAELQSRITKAIEGLFRIRQLQVHRSFALESARLHQHRTGGTSLIVMSPFEATLRPSGNLDSVQNDASGAVVRDTKSERIADDTKFIDSMTPKLAHSPQLMALLQSYKAAVEDPANELVHLYEIRDALSEHYGGDAEARQKLRITKTDWSRLGELANDAPLKEGRHRGGHPELRHATAAQLGEARKIARCLIEEFANQP